MLSYQTMMVHLELGITNQPVLRIVKDLASRFGSQVVGSVAGRMDTTFYDDGCRSGDLIARDLYAIESEMLTVEREFKSAFDGRDDLAQWRPSRGDGRFSPSFVCEARCADLVVMGIPVADPVARTWLVDVADVVLGCGRPVLVVPSRADRFDFGNVVVCWEDAREARRAISDALPLLKQAKTVEIVEIVTDGDLAPTRSRLDDLIGWLERHGVSAIASPACGDDPVYDLRLILEKTDPDLVVAGAYGHGRLREWALGGVSRDLLIRPGWVTLLSH